MSTMQSVGRFSNRMDKIKSSCVRDIMARMNAADTISFAAGLPTPELFPAAAVARAAQDVLADDAAGALQYGSTEGYIPLREYVAQEILAPQGITASVEEIIIVNGSQQALDIAGKVFLDPGNTVLLERPAYMAAMQAFDLCQARYVTAPMTEQGIDVNSVQKILAQQPVRLIYTVPDFHNPTGLCYSEEVRRDLIRALDGYPIVLVEDNPYGQLRYDGKQLPPLRSLRQNDTVLMGSFSKVFAPGFRLGWVHADRETIRAMTIAKQASDLCGNQFAQRVLHRFLLDNDLAEHIERLRKCYRIRRDTMLRLLEEHMPAGTTWTKPAGGMFIWVTLPEELGATEVVQKCVTRGLAFAPGESFFAEKPLRNTMRLNFTHSAPDSMDKGIRILAEEIKSLLKAPIKAGR